MLRETDRAWFSRFLWHLARKQSGSILTTPEPAWGTPSGNGRQASRHKTPKAKAYRGTKCGLPVLKKCLRQCIWDFQSQFSIILRVHVTRSLQRTTATRLIFQPLLHDSLHQLVPHQTGVKVEVHTIDIAPLCSESLPQKCSGMARVLKGFHSFTCPPTCSSAIGMSHTCHCLPSPRWYSFTDPRGMEGWVDLGAK